LQCKNKGSYIEGNCPQTENNSKHCMLKSVFRQKKIRVGGNLCYNTKRYVKKRSDYVHVQVERN
jgi:hypothetical protein